MLAIALSPEHRTWTELKIIVNQTEKEDAFQMPIETKTLLSQKQSAEQF